MALSTPYILFQASGMIVCLYLLTFNHQSSLFFFLLSHYRMQNSFILSFFVLYSVPDLFLLLSLSVLSLQCSLHYTVRLFPSFTYSNTSTIFLDVIPYSPVQVYRHFQGLYSFYIQGQRVRQSSNQQEASTKPV
jgi:hypothetical protein